MLADEIFTLQECSNDTSTIHLHFDATSNVWVCFGYSAYALNLAVRNRHLSYLASYSTQLMMPCVIVDKPTVDYLCKSAVVLLHESTYIKIRSLRPFDVNDYSDWAKNLKARADNAVLTRSPSSSMTCHDEYIRDNMSSFERNVKRIGDCLMAAVAMVVFSPIFCACYIAIKAEDHGSAIYKQERIGRFGRPFYIYKFRSMSANAEKDGPMLSHSGGNADSRLTKVGAFLRAHHLDELPQLWNVFCGDMAFIGPRPERQFYIDKILEIDRRYTFLYQIRPGVTSYATLYNGYTDTIEKMLRRLEYDLYYLEHRSWWFDFKILFNTFRSILTGKKF